MTTYKIIEATPDSKVGDTLRGGVAELWRCKDHEVILAGPANTGKTYGGMHKLDALLWKYPGDDLGYGQRLAGTDIAGR